MIQADGWIFINTDLDTIHKIWPDTTQDASAINEGKHAVIFQTLSNEAVTASVDTPCIPRLHDGRTTRKLLEPALQRLVHGYLHLAPVGLLDRLRLEGGAVDLVREEVAVAVGVHGLWDNGVLARLGEQVVPYDALVGRAMTAYS